MWQLTRNSVNTLAATFQDTELAGGGSQYLIEFKSLEMTPVTVIAQILVDTTRSTQFTIELNAVEDAANGVIQLRPGHYDVDVYRQVGATNIDPLDSVVLGVVFSGEAFVENASTEGVPIYYLNTLSAATYYEQV